MNTVHAPLVPWCPPDGDDASNLRAVFALIVLKQRKTQYDLSNDWPPAMRLREDIGTVLPAHGANRRRLKPAQHVPQPVGDDSNAPHPMDHMSTCGVVITRTDESEWSPYEQQLHMRRT